MATLRFDRHRRTGIAVLLATLLLATPLAGCLDLDRDDPLAVRTTCPGVTTPLTSVPVPAAYERADAGPVVSPPYQGVIRVLLLHAANADPSVLNGSRLAARELKGAGAPVEVVEVAISGRGAQAGRAAMESAVAQKPSIVVSALDNATTEGMVPFAVERRIPLVATEATALSLTTVQETSGFVYRVPPPLAAEGRAAAELVWSSGCRSVNVLQGNDPRDADVLQSFRVAYEAKGGTIGRIVPVDRSALGTTMTNAEFLRSETGKEAPRPEAILVIAAPDEAGTLLKVAFNRSIAAKSTFFFAERAKSPELVRAAGEDRSGHQLATGLRGTSLMGADTRMTGLFGRDYGIAYEAPATNASAHAYDAVYASVLAATCARSPEPARVAGKLAAVVNRDAGDTDVSGADPVLALTVGATCAVNYVGATHDYDWTRQGDPAKARWFVWSVDGTGALRVTQPRVEA